MDEPKCAVEIGIHTGPYWKDKNSKLIVCSRHAMQYDQRQDEFTKFEWIAIPVCIGCGTYDSLKWWKCCPQHCTEQGPDLVCDACRYKLHAPKLFGSN